MSARDEPTRFTDPETTSKIAEVLHEHTLHLLTMEDGDPDGTWSVECNCSMESLLADGFFDGERKFARHQAEQLADIIREVKEKVWDECASLAPEYITHNPYRSADG